MANRRLRVLAIAEAANPEWASVPLVGWSLARALAAHADVTLVTQIRNAEAIGRAQACFREVGFIDSEVVARPMWKIANALGGGRGTGWTTLAAFNALAYYAFEREVWKQYGSRIRAHEFDVVHRITPLSPTAASPIARRCRAAEVPFVLGPLNGGVRWPREFRDARHAEREWLSYVRGLYRLLPAQRAMLANAAAILCGSLATRSDLPESARKRAVYLPENAVDPERFPMHERVRGEDGPIRVAFVGRLVPYKGPDMLIEAVAPAVRAGAICVDMIGDGPLAPDLKRRVDELGLQAGVRFHGWLPHAHVHRVLGDAHVLGFPSVREFGGGVVLEAMALGVVPVVVDYAGPAELVTAQTGFKVPLGTRESIIAGMRECLERLAVDRAPLAGMSASARERVRALYTWDAKAHQVQQVYAWALGAAGNAHAPSFGFLDSRHASEFTATVDA